MRWVTLGQMLTDKQIERCRVLFPDREQIRDEVIIPGLVGINQRLGQENDPDYLSYAIVHALMRDRDLKRGKDAN